MNIPVSIGVIAYNEEKNIARLLNSLLNQKTDKIIIDEIIVVSSGSTDKTNKIIQEYSKKNDKIRIIIKKERRGKASAVNEFIKTAKNKILVLESGDTVPKEETVEKLCLPLAYEKVGMVCSKPIPTDSSNTFMGYLTNLFWEAHHHSSIKNPKGGEMIAFRKIFNKIAEDTAVDEPWIEYEIKTRGYTIVYSTEAVVYNKGPETINEFLSQRRRITFGYVDLKKRTNYNISAISTKKITSLISTLFKIFPYRNPKKWVWLFGALILELTGRILGYWDYYIKKKNYTVWKIAKTTKELKIRD